MIIKLFLPLQDFPVKTKVSYFDSMNTKHHHTIIGYIECKQNIYHTNYMYLSRPTSESGLFLNGASPDQNSDLGQSKSFSLWAEPIQN